MDGDTGFSESAPEESSPPAPAAREKVSGEPSKLGNWVATYCDMVTLLMTFFIIIVTFSSREDGKEKFPKLRNSIVSGGEGTGVAGETTKLPDQPNLFWRQVLMTAQPGPHGSRTPPHHTDPSLENGPRKAGNLPVGANGGLADSFRMRIPLQVFVGPDGKTTPQGKALLQDLARKMRNLPFDVDLQAAGEEEMRTVARLALELMQDTSLGFPRVGLGRTNTDTTEGGFVYLLLRSRI